MDEKQKEAIRKQAEQLLEKFGKSLESVKLKEKEVKKVEGGFREEESGSQNNQNSDFRVRMFANAPNKNKDFIIAEKKSW